MPKPWTQNSKASTQNAEPCTMNSTSDKSTGRGVRGGSHDLHDWRRAQAGARCERQGRGNEGVPDSEPRTMNSTFDGDTGRERERGRGASHPWRSTIRIRHATGVTDAAAEERDHGQHRQRVPLVLGLLEREGTSRALGAAPSRTSRLSIKKSLSLARGTTGDGHKLALAVRRTRLAGSYG